MGRLLFNAIVSGSAVWGASVPAGAVTLVIPGRDNSSFEASPLEDVGYWRRQYRRHGYPTPYAYYPPAYGYYVPGTRIPSRLRLRASLREWGLSAREWDEGYYPPKWLLIN